MSKNVVFLDYDDVVNKAMWQKDKDGKWRCRYNFPRDNAVNDEQAVQWVSEFCQEYDYSIVVSSSWRTEDNYKECLRNAGLREGIAIDGCTPVSRIHLRGDEIHAYLEEHPEITGFLIFDDLPEDCFNGYENHLVQCKNGGFMMPEFNTACQLHYMLNEN